MSVPMALVRAAHSRISGTAPEEADEDLEYEENPFIKVEQQVLLEPWRQPPPSPTLSAVASNANAPFLDVFVEQFIDAFAPDSRDDCGSSSAIRKAGAARMFSPLLAEAFQAVSIGYFGLSTGCWSVACFGYQAYCQTLAHLQRALMDPEQSRSEGVLATVILMMAYESLHHTSESALIKHCVGALQLIEFRNPWNHVFGIEHSCFVELLPYWVATALVLRKPTFLSRMEWKMVPWSANGRYKDIMACLLEHVVDLPAILWRSDQYLLALQTGSKSPRQLIAQIRRLWASISELEARLCRWKRDWADTYAPGQPSEVQSQGADCFPVFQYQDANTLVVVTPPTIVYPDPQLARTLCTYYAAMLLLSSVDTRPIDMIPRTETLEQARLICRSMEYYIRSVPGNMINRMAFPLRAAYDFLPSGSTERRFVEEVFRLVERKNTLRSWGSFIPDISTRR